MVLARRVGGHFRGSRLPGADGPYRLIGDDDFGELLFGQTGDPLPALADQGGLRVAALAIFQAFSHADDGSQVEFQRGLRALQDRLIGLAEILTAFAVPDNGITSPPRHSTWARKFLR